MRELVLPEVSLHQILKTTDYGESEREKERVRERERERGFRMTLSEFRMPHKEEGR